MLYVLPFKDENSSEIYIGAKKVYSFIVVDRVEEFKKRKNVLTNQADSYFERAPWVRTH